jgi:probable phosphoglycerate mutase
MSGRWKIKHEDMRRLALEARELCSTLSAGGGSVDFEWIPRESNKAADALSNEAMDGHTVRRVLTPTGETGEPVHAAATRSPGRSSSEEPAGGRSSGGRERAGLRLLLVQAPDDPALVARIASAVTRLVGSNARVLGTPDPTADAVLETLGETLDTTPVTESDWAGHAGSGGHDARVSAAYDSLLEVGGTVVVVTSRRGVLTVLTDVLGLPDERFWSIATAPGSLTGIEVWPDGSASVAFTNRTDHLA